MKDGYGGEDTSLKSGLFNLNGFNRLNRKNRVTGFEKFAFGTGEVATNMIFTIATSLLVTFYTDVAHVNAAVIGLIIAISQVFNGISDISVGFIIDHTRSKYGRARVWMLRTALPFTVAAILLMTVPQTVGKAAQAIYIFITYNLMLSVVYTFVQLPYATTMSYMTRNQKERASMNILRMSMSPIGNILITLVFTKILTYMPNGGDDNQDNWIRLTTIYAIVAGLLMLFCFTFVRERVEVNDKYGEKKVPLKKAIMALVQNKYFILLFLFFVFYAMYQTLSGTVTTYYCKWIIGDMSIIGYVNTACYGITIFATLLLGKVMHYTTKRNWCVLGSIFIIIGSLVVALNPNSIGMVTFGGLLRGIGMTPILGMIYTMAADVIEYGQWKTKIRTAGAIQAATTSGQKFGQGISAAAVGIIMSLAHYDGSLEAQSDLTLQVISNMFIYGMALLGVIMIIVLFFYRLDYEYPKMMKELLEREKGRRTKKNKRKSKKGKRIKKEE